MQGIPDRAGVRHRVWQLRQRGVVANADHQGRPVAGSRACIRRDKQNRREQQNPHHGPAPAIRMRAIARSGQCISLFGADEQAPQRLETIMGRGLEQGHGVADLVAADRRRGQRPEMAPERNALLVGDDDDESRGRGPPVGKPEFGDVDAAASERGPACFVLDGNAVGGAAAGPGERQSFGSDDSSLGGNEGGELSQRTSLPGRLPFFKPAPDQGGSERKGGFPRVHDEPRNCPTLLQVPRAERTAAE